MSAIVLPGRSRFALAMREPNLLLPNERPIGRVKANRQYSVASLFDPYVENLSGRPRSITDFGGGIYTHDGYDSSNSGSTSNSAQIVFNAGHQIRGSILCAQWKNKGAMVSWANVFSIDVNGVFWGHARRSGNDCLLTAGGIGLTVTLPSWAHADGAIITYAISSIPTSASKHTAVFAITDNLGNIYTNSPASDTWSGTDIGVCYIGSEYSSYTTYIDTNTVFRALSITPINHIGADVAALVDYCRNFYKRTFHPANDTPYLVSVPAGGGVTLTVQSATHSHSAESPSLVQDHALTPVDALHSHVAESPSMTQANALNPENSAHDHSAEQPSLSSASIVAAADALHGHTSEQPSIIQTHILAVVSAMHAHTADNVTLTVGGTLAPDDALHGHLVDEPTITQAGVLAPADVLHGHTAEQPSLVQANSLSPEDTAHAHSAEQPTLDLSVFVTPADSTHGHAADSPALTQANLLAVADAVHAHLADSPALSQHITVVASDALHAHLSESPNIVLGTLPLMSGRVYLSRATLRVYRPEKRLNS